MRSTLHTIAALGLYAAAAMPVHAGEITVGGKPCNDLCQSWLGLPRGHRPPLEAPSRPAPIERVREPEPALPRASVAPRIAAAPLPSRVVVTAPAPRVATLPPAARVAVLPTAPRAAELPPVPRVAVLPAAPRPVALSASPTQAVSTTIQLPPDPDFVQPAPDLPVARRGQVVNEAVTGGQLPAATPTQRIFAELPKSSELVAVPGAIMVETAEARARRERQLADLLSETSRPKKAAVAPSVSAPGTPKASVVQPGDPE